MICKKCNTRLTDEQVDRVLDGSLNCPVCSCPQCGNSREEVKEDGICLSCEKRNYDAVYDRKH